MKFTMTSDHLCQLMIALYSRRNELDVMIFDYLEGDEKYRFMADIDMKHYNHIEDLIKHFNPEYKTNIAPKRNSR